MAGGGGGGGERERERERGWVCCGEKKQGKHHVTEYYQQSLIKSVYREKMLMSAVNIKVILIAHIEELLAISSKLSHSMIIHMSVIFRHFFKTMGFYRLQRPHFTCTTPFHLLLRFNLKEKVSPKMKKRE